MTEKTSGFNSGDKELNEFLTRQAFAYQEKGIAKTYLARLDGRMVGYFSLCTDAIRLSEKEREVVFGVSKPHADYPAVKIARLAISEDAQRQGIGRALVRLAFGIAGNVNHFAACRFLTVDAYGASAGFYEKTGFVKNTSDKSGSKVSLRLDLIETPTA